MKPHCRRPRVSLRRLSDDDVRAVSWLHEALLDPDGDALVITRGGELVGALQHRVGEPQRGWLAFRSVAVQPQLRGLGVDSEAVRLVEDDALERGLAHRFWAAVRHDDGLAFYFWLRLGYRPAKPGEDFWPRGSGHGIICMLRVGGDQTARGR